MTAISIMFLMSTYTTFIAREITHEGDVWNTTGKITRLENVCGVDGECSITARGLTILTGCSLSVAPIDMCHKNGVPGDL